VVLACSCYFNGLSIILCYCSNQYVVEANKGFFFNHAYCGGCCHLHKLKKLELGLLSFHCDVLVYVVEMTILNSFEWSSIS
jgi:hypothetical protein